MARIVLFVVIAFLVWLAIRVVGARRPRGDVAPSAAMRTDASAGTENILQCAWCGVHVPVGSVIALPDGRAYCSPEHRDAARAASGTAERR